MNEHEGTHAKNRFSTAKRPAGIVVGTKRRWNSQLEFERNAWEGRSASKHAIVRVGVVTDRERMDTSGRSSGTCKET